MKEYPAFSLGIVFWEMMRVDKGLYDESTYWGRVKYNMIRCDFRYFMFEQVNYDLERSFLVRRPMTRPWPRLNHGRTERTSIRIRSFGTLVM